MASVTRTSGGVTYDANAFQNRLNALRSKFVADGMITAADFNELVSLWNIFNDHQHSISDLYGIKDYGDGSGNPGYSTSGNYEADYLYTPSGLAGDVGGVGVGNIIYASTQNALSNALGGGANHYHGWDDRSS